MKSIGQDKTLLVTHVSLFTALFICWQRSNYSSPFRVSRQLLMGYSKIASKATYHKCMRELCLKGYIRYNPSYHPKLGSEVWWMG
ncbi:hypothetical protein [Pedobacter aquatilis]|uniref:hypothetical protein n=1 Tax=Pedobacter aquatilis TaxID=351343 RepID=UPI0029307C02|nr:hypothetical protein [Pedobacter aquatilis]